MTFGCGTAVSGAYPMTRNAPHVAMNRSGAPTTAECEAEFGFACYQPYQIERAYNVPALWAQGDEGQPAVAAGDPTRRPGAAVRTRERGNVRLGR
jgi:hypothetical protein